MWYNSLEMEYIQIYVAQSLIVLDIPLLISDSPQTTVMFGLDLIKCSCIILQAINCMYLAVYTDVYSSGYRGVAMVSAETPSENSARSK